MCTFHRTTGVHKLCFSIDFTPGILTELVESDEWCIANSCEYRIAVSVGELKNQCGVNIFMATNLQRIH